MQGRSEAQLVRVTQQYSTQSAATKQTKVVSFFAPSLLASNNGSTKKKITVVVANNNEGVIVEVVSKEKISNGAEYEWMLGRLGTWCR